MILSAILTVGGVGLTFAILIALANKKLKVWEDPRIDVVAGMLPQANCGACGLPGCRAFAEAVVGGKVQPSGCNVMNKDGVAAVATYLGVDAGTSIKKVARLLCAGGLRESGRLAVYQGLPTCSAAAAVAGGGKSCSWGCLGLGDCDRACNFGAIEMNQNGLPVVDLEKCTACGDCVRACPKDLFVILPAAQQLLVQCRNLISGDGVRELCRVACTTCGKCVQDAPAGVISIATGVAVVDPRRAAEASPTAVGRCPTGAIVWLEQKQVAPDVLTREVL